MRYIYKVERIPLSEYETDVVNDLAKDGWRIINLLTEKVIETFKDYEGFDVDTYRTYVFVTLERPMEDITSKLNSLIT